jgi:hypothetical protein
MDRVIFLFILLFFGVSLSLRLDIYFSIDINDNINILNITTSWRHEEQTLPEGNYTIQILKDDKIFYQKRFNVDFFIFSNPPTQVNEKILVFSIPFSPEIKSLRIIKNGKILLEENIRKYFCNDNGICETNENFYICPSDCPSGFKDGICDSMIDGRCDPDCEKDMDLDCNPYLKELILEDINKTETATQYENRTKTIFNIFKDRNTLIIVVIVLIVLILVLIIAIILKRKQSLRLIR